VALLTDVIVTPRHRDTTSLWHCWRTPPGRWPTCNLSADDLDAPRRWSKLLLSYQLSQEATWASEMTTALSDMVLTVSVYYDVATALGHCQLIMLLLSQTNEWRWPDSTGVDSDCRAQCQRGASSSCQCDDTWRTSTVPAQIIAVSVQQTTWDVGTLLVDVE